MRPTSLRRSPLFLLAAAALIGFSALPAAASEADQAVDDVKKKCQLTQIGEWKAPPLPEDGLWDVTLTRDSAETGYAQWHETSRGVVVEELAVGSLEVVNIIGVDAKGTYWSVWSDCSRLSGKADANGAATLEGKTGGEEVATTIAYALAKPPELAYDRGGATCKDNNLRCGSHGECCSKNCVDGNCKAK